MENVFSFDNIINHVIINGFIDFCKKIETPESVNGTLHFHHSFTNYVRKSRECITQELQSVAWNGIVFCPPEAKLELLSPFFTSLNFYVLEKYKIS